MIGNGGHQGGPVGEVPIGPWLTPQPPAPQPPQTGLLTLCFQHLERCRDQRFSKPTCVPTWHTLVYGVISESALHCKQGERFCLWL